MRKIIGWMLVALTAVGAQGGYTPLAYLEATGKQWIHTGYTPNGTDRVETKVRYSSVSGNPFLFCAREANGKNSYSCVLVNGCFRFDHGATTSQQTKTTRSLVTGVDYSLVLNGATGTCTLTNTTLCTMHTASYTPAGPFALMATHEAGANLSASTTMGGFFSGRFYYFRVYDSSGTLVRDFIPVRDDSAAADSVQRYGLFETVTGVFHPNYGSVAFTPGPDAGPEPHRMTRTVEVSSLETADDGTVQVPLTFANFGYAQRLFIAWGASDGGMTTNGWEHVDALADVGAWETSRTVALPAGAIYARLFMQPAIPGARMLASLTSSGTDEYVDTGFMPDSNSSASCTFKMFAKPASTVCPFGSRNAGTYQFLTLATNANRWLFRFGNKVIDNATVGKPGVVGEHTFLLERNQYIFDGILRTLPMNTFSKKYNFYVFALNDNNVASMYTKMEFSSLLLWDDGVLARAYVPCVKSDGTPALYDTVTGRFDVNQGATALTCGDEVWTVSESISLIKPVRATWAGQGETDAFTDPANWDCRNMRGDALAGQLPTADTEVTIEGTVSFNWPVGRTLACKSIAFNCVLATDADWRGLDSTRVVEGAKIDLAGHTLQVSELAFSGTITGKEDLTQPDATRVSSSTTFTASSASDAFNDNFTWGYQWNCSRVLAAQDKLPLELVYDFGEGQAQTVNCYRLFGNGVGNKERSPKSWTLQGSQDRTTWTLLDTRTSETGWTPAENVRTYSFANTTAYRYYRLEFTASESADASYLEFTQLEFFNGPAPVSELHVDVPEGTNAVNSSVKLNGSLKLVKEGKGSLTMSLERQYYTGGTVVAAGTLKAGANGSVLYGAGLVRVLADGTFDVNGHSGSCCVQFVVDGGLLTNTGATLRATDNTIGSVLLTQDSRVVPTAALGGWHSPINMETGVCLDLGGHTLDVAEGETIQFVGPGIVTNGTVRVRCPFTTYSYPVEASTVDFVLSNELCLYKSITVCDLTLLEGAYNLITDGTISVKGVFTTQTNEFPNVQMLDGSTLNLSAETEPWSVESATAGLTTFFAENAAVTLNLGSRKLRDGMQVLAWTEGQEPANVRTARFSVKGTNYGTRVGDDGLYLVNRGLIIIIK